MPTNRVPDSKEDLLLIMSACDYVNERLAERDFEALAPARGGSGMSAREIEAALKSAGVTPRGLLGRRQYSIRVRRGAGTDYREVEIPVQGHGDADVVAICRVQVGDDRPSAVVSVGPRTLGTAR